MLDNEYNNLIVKFLQKNYPVSRIKVNSRFKRAIVLDDGAYLLSDGESARPLKTKLIQTLKTVFDCDTNTANSLISQALNI